MTDTYLTLPGRKAVAISGRTGSGKSTLFYHSKQVTRIFLADSGSGGHHFNKLDQTQIVEVDITNPAQSPVVQAMGYVKKWSDEGRLWLLDSFTTLQEQMVAWFKLHYANASDRHLRAQGRVLLEDHQRIVGDLRDLALFLSARAGFVLFNTSPGGQVRDPDGKLVELPKGALVGYPALAGLRENSESILARFTSSWIVFPGYIEKDKATDRIKRQIPRGFLLPWRDLRGGNVGNYAPIKDPMQVLQDTVLEEKKDPPVAEPTHGQAPPVAPPAAPVESKPRLASVHVIPRPKSGESFIDAMLELIAAKYPTQCRVPIAAVEAPEVVSTPSAPPAQSGGLAAPQGAASGGNRSGGKRQ